jgi:energy-converting hydrogenase Eha subunit B
MIVPYLGLYWSVWPHLLLDISLFVSCVSIYLLGTPGERLVLALFWWFCTVSCARAPKIMILRYLGLYWSVWPHLLLDICLFVSCVSIYVLGMPRERLVLALFWWFYTVSCARAPKIMILQYLGLYWSVWPHLLLDICLFVSCMSIYLLGMPREWLVFALFWWFCTVSCARAPKIMILQYLGLYWSVWPHLLLDICLFVSCMSIYVLGMPRERLVLALFWWFCTCTCLAARLEYVCIDSMQDQCYKCSSVVPPLHYRVGTETMKMSMGGLLKWTNKMISAVS